MSSNDEKKWFVVQVKPNSYDKAQRNLEHQGIETFSPTFEVTKRNFNRFFNDLVYLFPGYMFVAFNPFIINWSKINNTYGVTRILTFNGKPGEVSLGMILWLKKRYIPNYKLLPKHYLQRGDKIKILSGPFADFTAKIQSISDQKRVWALMDFLGETRKLNLNNDINITYEKVE